MTPLRKKMIDIMVLKGFSPSTQSTYLYAIEKIARYYHRSPDLLDSGDIEAYCVYLLKEKNMASASVRVIVNAVRFFFRQVLRRSLQEVVIRYPKKPQRIPELLTREEVRAILSHAQNLKHYTLLATGYAAGLRVSEIVTLRVRDIDTHRALLYIRQGKGNKDRAVFLTPSLLLGLRRYWQQYRAHDWLFYSHDFQHHITITVAQKAFRKAKAAAGITKHGGIHSLRHAYATHQLDAGLPTHLLQRQLGHQSLTSTLRYVHWLPHYHSNGIREVDLLIHH